jgi:hypothetical protein
MKPTLTSLPRLNPPKQLQTQLRVMASRHAQRRRHFATVRGFVRYVREETLLLFNNLARPYAVPCAGGLLSALFLFGLVAPTFAVNRHISGDVPTAISTQASLEFSLALPLTGEMHGFDEIVVDVTTDEQGRVTGFTVPVGQTWATDRAVVRSLESTLIYTKFTPATIFGQPATGKTRITIRRNSVDVRG